MQTLTNLPHGLAHDHAHVEQFRDHLFTKTKFNKNIFLSNLSVPPPCVNDCEPALAPDPESPASCPWPKPPPRQRY